MTDIDEDWLEHQRKRWMRPNAHLWLRPDAHRWFVSSPKFFDLRRLYERKYAPTSRAFPRAIPMAGNGRAEVEAFARGSRRTTSRALALGALD